MKKKLQLIFLIMLTGLMTRAQISGTYDIPGATYPTLASAIAALNVAGVGPGGVTFNIAAGYTETFTSSTAGHITNGNGTAANPIVFQKSGTGANPVITAGTGILALRDIIICLEGTSYVTFDGIDLLENPANTEPRSRTEWGYAILKASKPPLIQGSWHNTIKNCAVSLAGDYERTWAVYLNNITSDTVQQLPITSLSGTSSFNTISGLTITNCVGGIRLQGFNDLVSPWTFYDQNNTVTGNTITLTGGGLTTEEQPKGLYIWYTNRLDVSYNTINGTIPATSYAPNCITLGYANGASWDCYYNTVSVTYLGSIGSFIGIQSTPYGELGTNNITSFHHNKVMNCSYPKAGIASSGNFVLMNIGMGVTSLVYDNEVTNNTMGDGTTAAAGDIRHMAIYKGTLVDGPTSIYNNLVSGNSRLQSTPTNSPNSYMYINFSTYPGTYDMLLDIYNNTIENNTTTSTSFMDLLRLQCAVGTKCHHNIIRNNTGGGTINGIFNSWYGGLAGIHPVYEIYNNRVENLTSTISNNQAYYVQGLVDMSGCHNYWYNNFISGLKAPNSQSVNAVVAANFDFSSTNTNTNYFYNNTIFLDAASSSLTNFGSTGVLTSQTRKLEMKNNIIVNTSVSKGTGKTVALRFSGPVTTVNYLAESNNNLFYSGTPGPNNLIYFDGTNSDQTLSVFKARVAPRDNSSVTEMPPFVNVASFPYDIHLATNVGTQCESQGITADVPSGSITSDFDDQPRFPLPGYPVNPSYPATAPDIGADEFGGLGFDVTPPSIKFSPLANTSILGSRTLTSSIKDASGVPNSGTGLPRLYWKINQGGTWNTSVATWLNGNTCTFSLGSGAVVNDSVYYYIVAQDNAIPVNVGSNPVAPGCTPNPPACTPPPANSACYAYKITPGMCGTYNIGAGQTYQTLTAAVTALSQSSITCPVVLQLTDASYPSETFPIVLGTYTGMSATNTVTIKPAPGVDAVISGTTTTAIFKLSKASYFIIDGSNNGTSSRNLTISNTGTSGSTAVIWIASQGTQAGSTNDVIKNCNISNGYRAGNAFAIFIAGNTSINTFSGGDDNDNITISNNAISNSTYGIYAMANVTGFLDNLVIADNILGSDIPASSLSSKGILINTAIAAQVTGNEIYNLIGTGSKTGIELQRNLLNTMVKGNKIHDFQVDANSSGGSLGINAGTGSDVFNTTLVNNLIYNLTTTNSSLTSFTANPFGIRLQKGSGYKLYHNTVRMAGTQAAHTSNSASLSSALLIMEATIADMRNNILTNSIEGLAGSKSYCIYMDENSMFPTITSSNYNDYWPSGTYGILGRYADINTFTGMDISTLAGWQAASGKDANSKNVDPVFTSATSLVPTTTLMPHAGIYIPEFPTDYANVNRTNPPDIGAYEYSLTPLVVTTAASGVSGTTAVLNGTINPQGMIVEGYFEYGLTTAYGNSVATMPPTVTGNAAVPVSASLSGLLPNTTYHYRITGVDQGGFIAVGSDQTFTIVGSTEAGFLSFAFNVAENPSLSADVSGTIDPATFTITLDVIENVSLSSLVATFTLSDLATASIGGMVQVSGVTSNNFTNPVVYTVTAEAGNTQNWTVTVTTLPCLSPWEFTQTGKVHSISIPLDVAPEIFGTTLAALDWIGIFYIDDNGEEACAGAVQWTGNSGVVINAYGDDPTTSEKDGFANEEAFRWRLNQCGNSVEYRAFAEYDSSMPNQGNFADFGLSKVTSLQTSFIQDFNLEQGWNSLSSFVIPENPAVETIFAPIVGQLNILRNLSSLYWPVEGANTIGDWDLSSGYAINLSEASDLRLTGESFVTNTITIPEGWSYLPVLSQCNTNVLAMFAEFLDEVIIIQELIGTNVFWPAFDIYSLESFEPGKAYIIKLNNEITISFPPCDNMHNNKQNQMSNQIESEWGKINMTPLTQLVLFPQSVLSNFNLGDVVGAFDHEGHIFGYMRVNSLDENQRLMIFGNDRLSNLKNGFDKNELIKFKLLRPETKEEFSIDVTYNTILDNSSGKFISGSFAAVANINLYLENDGLPTNKIGIYPNPAKDKITLTGITERTEIRIYNVFGEQVLFEITNSPQEINLSLLKEGTYIVKITTKYGRDIHKLIIK